MRKYTKIHSYFWEIANYNTFYMKFCKTSFNSFSGIGLILFIQICIAFFSGYLATSLFNLNWLINLGIGLIFAFVTFFYIKYSTLFLSNSFSRKRLLILFTFSIIISLFLTLPFLLIIFQSQIEYVFLINHGLINITNINRIWKLPYGLFELCFIQENDLIVFFVSSTLFILMLFILFYPYSLIYNNKTSLYYKIIKIYEERFNQE